MLAFTLPYPPTSNNLHAVVRGRKVLSKKGREYHAAVALEVIRLGRPKMPKGRLVFHLDAYPPDRRRRDVANLEKIVVDSLVKAEVILDDCLIDRLEIQRCAVEKGGRVSVRIMTTEEQGQ